MKHILILGGGSDIARATAAKYAASGWRVSLAGRNKDVLSHDAEDLHIRHGVPAAAVHFDALDTDSHQKFYDSFDVAPDTVCCVFGYMGDQEKVRHDFSEAKRTIDTNFTGAVSILGIAADAMEKRGSGCIIGVSSVAGDRGRQSNYIYGAAKAGFSAFLAGLRNRLFPTGVHCMTVKPGFVRTRMTEGMDLPGALTADPEQVAAQIYKGAQRKTDVLYTLGRWRLVMLIVKLIPEAIFKRLKM